MKKIQILALLFFMVNSVYVFSINFRGAGKSVQTLCRSIESKQVTRNCSSKKDHSLADNSHEVVIMVTPILILTGYLCYGEGRSRGRYEVRNSAYRSGYEDGKKNGLKSPLQL